jgi:hypothetical protein
MICVKLWQINCSVIYVEVICSPSHSIICVSLDKSGADLRFCKGGGQKPKPHFIYNLYFLEKEEHVSLIFQFSFSTIQWFWNILKKRRAALWRLLESCSASKSTYLTNFLGESSAERHFPHTFSGHVRFHRSYKSILNPDFLGTTINTLSGGISAQCVESDQNWTSLDTGTRSHSWILESFRLKVLRSFWFWYV